MQVIILTLLFDDETLGTETVGSRMSLNFFIMRKNIYSLLVTYKQGILLNIHQMITHRFESIPVQS